MDNISLAFGAARYGSATLRRNQRRMLLIALTAALLPLRVSARELIVGPGAPFALPSEAAAVAQSGDVVRILPGTYYDCAVWHRDNLTIEGSGNATRITDRVCQGKAIFVVSGNDVAIRNLVLARARQLDGSGAAIRAEGGNLTLQNLRVENNQDGVLATGARGGTLHIEDCVFVANGAQDTARPSGAVRAGALERLVIRRSVFGPARGMFAIRSAAALTEIEDSHIAAPPDAVATIEVAGGLRMTDTIIAPVGFAGPAILAPPARSDAPFIVRRVQLSQPGILLRDRSGRGVQLSSNILPPNSVEIVQDGAGLRWLRWFAGQVTSTLPSAVRAALH